MCSFLSTKFGSNVATCYASEKFVYRISVCQILLPSSCQALPNLSSAAVEQLCCITVKVNKQSHEQRCSFLLAVTHRYAQVGGEGNYVG